MCVCVSESVSYRTCQQTGILFLQGLASFEFVLCHIVHLSYYFAARFYYMLFFEWSRNLRINCCIEVLNILFSLNRVDDRFCENCNFLLSQR